MAWQASRKERILIFGGPKVGKSFTYIGLMKFARQTKTDSHFFIVDNDNATEGIGLYPGGTYGDLLGDEIDVSYDEETDVERREYEHATIWVPELFYGYPAIRDEIKERGRPNDWTVIDMISNTWEIMPDWYIEQVYGENTWDYFAKTQKAIEEGDSGAGSRNFGGLPGDAWQLIGKEYRRWEKPLTLHSRGHVIAFAAETEIQAHHDKSGARRKEWESTSAVMPKGEKNLAHRFHTIVRMQKSVTGKKIERDLTVHGDRDRMDGWVEKGGRGLTIPVKEGPKFAFDYLVKMGGWKPSGG